jgi:antitoxin component YwqK of YwqJK toxin-antitoxin module
MRYWVFAFLFFLSITSAHSQTFQFRGEVYNIFPKKHTYHCNVFPATQGLSDGKYIAFPPPVIIEKRNNAFEPIKRIEKTRHPSALFSIKQGRLDGLYIAFNEVGATTEMTTFSDGVITGIRKHFVNKALKAEAAYEQGFLSYCKTYYKNQMVCSEEWYSRDSGSIKLITYFPTGKIKHFVQKQPLFFQTYFEDGSIKETFEEKDTKGCVQEGKIDALMRMAIPEIHALPGKNGTYTAFHHNGKIHYQGIYHQGKFIPTAGAKDSSGNTILEFNEVQQGTHVLRFLYKSTWASFSVGDISDGFILVQDLTQKDTLFYKLTPRIKDKPNEIQLALIQPVLKNYREKYEYPLHYHDKSIHLDEWDNTSKWDSVYYIPNYRQILRKTFHSHNFSFQLFSFAFLPNDTMKIVYRISIPELDMEIFQHQSIGINAVQEQLPIEYTSFDFLSSVQYSQLLRNTHTDSLVFFHHGVKMNGHVKFDAPSYSRYAKRGVYLETREEDTITCFVLPYRFQWHGRGKMKNGKMHGKWKMTYPSNTSLYFSEGQLNGSFTSSVNIWRIRNFNFNETPGKQTLFQDLSFGEEQPTCLQRVTYVNGYKHGVELLWNPNTGDSLFLAEYVYGKLQKLNLSNRKESKLMLDLKNHVFKFTTSKFANAIKTNYTVHGMLDGFSAHGKITVFKDKVKIAEGYLTHGIPHKEWRFYHPHTQEIMCSVNPTNRLPLYREEIILSDLFWLKPEELNGHFTYYYRSGAKKAEGIKENNCFVGKWLYYEKNGALIQEDNFFNRDSIHSITKEIGIAIIGTSKKIENAKTIEERYILKSCSFLSEFIHPPKQVTLHYTLPINVRGKNEQMQVLNGTGYDSLQLDPDSWMAGYFKNFKREGIWAHYYKGELRQLSTYKNNLLHGFVLIGHLNHTSSAKLFLSGADSLSIAKASEKDSVSFLYYCNGNLFDRYASSDSLTYEHYLNTRVFLSKKAYRAYIKELKQKND